MGTRLSLDSWAILAWLQGEPAGEVVRDLIAWSQGDEGAGERIKKELGGDLERPRLFINLVNLGEVFYLLGRRRGEREARETVEEIKAYVEVVPASEQLVFEAASLKIKYPIAYADAFALATAKAIGAPLVTGDPEFKGLHEVPLIWIGE
ncbi:MAG: type II toxin-antitoxin system VapC family toxin [Clostridia bacterium]|nr:type II toxin-antitoxin system VapC family toxin [Clostridia bacterium]